jgi:GntR family transcriptional regulator of abcA and norABC
MIRVGGVDMLVKIDRNRKEPLYRQIANTIEDSILKGELVPGMPLPPERKLAKQLGVNRSTITLAYEELRSTGLIQSQQGSYTRVAEHHWGISPRRTPNWYEYTNGGSFLPTKPMMKRIREGNEDSIDFSLGELNQEILPKEYFSEFIHDLSFDHTLSYPHPLGCPHFRETLADHLARQYALSVSPDEILITSGGHQALLLITQCLLKPGDSIAIEGPSYAYSLPLFTSAGLCLHQIPVDHHGLIPEEIIALNRKHRIRMVFANPTYQNPTGTNLSLSRRKKLLEICEELRIPIVEDDPYRSLTLEGCDAPPPSLISLNHGRELVIYLGSLSKTAAPGFRIGWIVAPRNVIKRLADAKHQMDYGTSLILQQMANVYLATGMWEKHLRLINSSLTLRRDIMLSALSKHLCEELEWNVPTGGYHIWCRTKKQIDIVRLLEISILNKVLFLPGVIMGAEKDFLRLTYAKARLSDIEEGIIRLKRSLSELESNGSTP